MAVLSIYNTLPEQVKINKDDIEALKSEIADKSEVEKLKTEVESVKTSVSTNTTDIATNKASIATNASSISSLKTRVSTNEKSITQLNSDIAETNTKVSLLYCGSFRTLSLGDTDLIFFGIGVYQSTSIVIGWCQQGDTSEPNMTPFYMDTENNQVQLFLNGEWITSEMVA